MDCRMCQNKIQDYLDGQLDDLEARELGAHTALCPECAEVMGDYAVLFEELGDLPRVTVDEAFATEVLGALDLNRYRTRPGDVLAEVLSIPGQVIPAPARLAAVASVLTAFVAALLWVGFYGREILAWGLSAGDQVIDGVSGAAGFVGAGLTRLGESLLLLRPLLDMLESAFHLGKGEMDGNIVLVGLLLFALSSIALAHFIRRNGRPSYHHVSLY